MERKIGEIFEYNGEWYQCLIGNLCRECDFSSNNITCDIHGTLICTCKGRSDETSVVFKKLEKVGEPYEYFIQGMGIIMVQEYILANANYIWDISRNIVVMDCPNGKVAIEIKQTKKEMVEKNGNTPLNVLTDKYVNGDICYDDFEKEVKALYSCKEEIKPTLKEFDLKAAKLGKPVCTRDGRKARIICFDRRINRPIVALIESDNHEEGLQCYFDNGRCCCDVTSGYDLMMLPEKKEGWMYINKISCMLDNKEIAEKNCPEGYVVAKVELEG